MKLLSPLLTTFMLAAISLPVSAQSSKELISKAESSLTGNIQISGEQLGTIQQRMVFYHVPGMSIAVIQNYKVIWAKGYGFADDSLKRPVTTNTLFQAGSVSKSLNAVAVLKLAQDKKIDLYADINEYLTHWKFPYDSISKGKKITMAQLLSHTAGVGLHGFPGYKVGDSIPTLVQILNGAKPANTPRIRSVAEPGRAQIYSGGGIAISQLAVTDITGQPYAQFMKAAVLKPLGMSNSTYNYQEATSHSQYAAGYGINGKQTPGQYRVYPELAAAGLWTTPTDLAKFVIETQLAYAGRSEKILNKASVKLQLQPYLNKIAALGVFIDSADNTKYFQHSGVTAGFSCQYYGSFENGNGVVVMTNSNHNEIIDEVVNSIAKAYSFKRLSKTVVKTLANVSDSDLQSYVGIYQLGPNFNVEVSKKGQQLFVQVPGRPGVKLLPEDKTHFFVVEAKIGFEFVKNDAGVVVGLRLSENGSINLATKVPAK